MSSEVSKIIPNWALNMVEDHAQKVDGLEIEVSPAQTSIMLHLDESSFGPFRHHLAAMAWIEGYNVATTQMKLNYEEKLKKATPAVEVTIVKGDHLHTACVKSYGKFKPIQHQSNPSYKVETLMAMLWDMYPNGFTLTKT